VSEVYSQGVGLKDLALVRGHTIKKRKKKRKRKENVAIETCSEASYV
jgi:hypothetical protein